MPSPKNITVSPAIVGDLVVLGKVVLEGGSFNLVGEPDGGNRRSFGLSPIFGANDDVVPIVSAGGLLGGAFRVFAARANGTVQNGDDLYALQIFKGGNFSSGMLWEVADASADPPAIRVTISLVRVAGGALQDVFRLDPSVVANDTAMLLFDVNSGTLKRVSVGVADSGGAGFRLLRIPN